MLSCIDSETIKMFTKIVSRKRERIARDKCSVIRIDWKIRQERIDDERRGINKERISNQWYRKMLLQSY